MPEVAERDKHFFAFDGCGDGPIAAFIHRGHIDLQEARQAAWVAMLEHDWEYAVENAECWGDLLDPEQATREDWLAQPVPEDFPQAEHVWFWEKPDEGNFEWTLELASFPKYNNEANVSYQPGTHINLDY